MQTATHPVREVRIPLAEGTLFGDLIEPAGSSALILFVNGRGRGRHCVEDRTLATPLHAFRVSTLLLDLLTVDEQQQPPQGGPHGLDVALLTRRVIDIAEWVRQQPELAALPLGLCGVAAGTAPALIAAARLGAQVQALVCIAGSPDQAGPTVLASIKAPTLLLDEPGVLERAGQMVADWFVSHLPAFEAAD